MSPVVLPVYVVHWNAPELCERTVRSVLASVDIEVDLTVIDNSDDAGTSLRVLLGGLAAVMPIGHNAGFTGAANVAIAHWLQTRPECPFAVVCNHDVIVEPTCLTELLGALRDNPAAGIAGPANSVSGGPVRVGGDFHGTSPRELAHSSSTPPIARARWVKGELMMIRRTAIESVGGFDERLGSYVEDVDLGLRMNQAGWSCLVLTSVVATSHGSVSIGTSRAIETNGVYVALKHGGPRQAARALGRITWLATRCALRILSPTTRADRRAASWLRLQRHTMALVDVLRRPSILRSFARDPAAGSDLSNATEQLARLLGRDSGAAGEYR